MELGVDMGGRKREGAWAWFSQGYYECLGWGLDGLSTGGAVPVGDVEGVRKLMVPWDFVSDMTASVGLMTGRNSVCITRTSTGGSWDPN